MQGTAWPAAGLLSTCKQPLVVSSATCLWSRPELSSLKKKKSKKKIKKTPEALLLSPPHGSSIPRQPPWRFFFSFAMCQEPVWFPSWSVTAADVVRFRAGNLRRDLFKALKPRSANGLTAISNQLRNWFPGLFCGQRLSTRLCLPGPTVRATHAALWGRMDGMQDRGKTLVRVDGHAGISLCAKLSQMAGDGRWKITFQGPILSKIHLANILWQSRVLQPFHQLSAHVKSLSKGTCGYFTQVSVFYLCVPSTSDTSQSPCFSPLADPKAKKQF